MKKATSEGRELRSFNTRHQADVVHHCCRIITGEIEGDVSVYRPFVDEFKSGSYW